MRALISFIILFSQLSLIAHASLEHHEHTDEIECQQCLIQDQIEFSYAGDYSSLLEVPKSFFKSFEKVLFQNYFFYFYFDNNSRGPPKELFA